jgi:formylglycine-generating enzyme required for sulfatase activity
MISVARVRGAFQPFGPAVLALALAAVACGAWRALAEEIPDLGFDPDKELTLKIMPKPYSVPDAEAKSEKEMKAYTEVIPGSDFTYEMVPIPGGSFMMGSPEDEEDRSDDEGPQIAVEIDPFWMGKYEVTWDLYDYWGLSLDIQRRKLLKKEQTEYDVVADALTRPTNAYTDMTFGMGHDGYPAICMTQYAGKMFCKWLSAKTGRYYRLPTEAEWEYACRAGTTTAYSFGDDPDDLDDYAWYFDNSEDGYSKIGEKKPNPWGLYDIHGNVSEWVLDQYVSEAYKEHVGNPVRNPFVVPTKEFPRAVRGGSWDDDPDRLRSAARRGSDPDWKMQDPQIPQSIYYLTDALFLGIRVVRPLRVPTEEQAKLYEPDPKIMAEYKEAQGGKQ